MGKQRNEVTKFIAQNKSRQEFVPPLGKYVDLLKAEPLHNTNNAWQSWFLTALAIAISIFESTINSIDLNLACQYNFKRLSAN